MSVFTRDNVAFQDAGFGTDIFLESNLVLSAGVVRDPNKRQQRLFQRFRVNRSQITADSALALGQLAAIFVVVQGLEFDLPIVPCLLIVGLSAAVNLGLQMTPKDKLTPEALGEWQKAEIAKWWPVIKAANVKVD